MRPRTTSQTTRDDPVFTVLESIADTRDSTSFGLEPLAESLDPELIEMVAQESNRSTQLTFEYEGCQVTVTPMGYQITPEDGPRKASSW